MAKEKTEKDTVESQVNSEQDIDTQSEPQASAAQVIDEGQEAVEASASSADNMEALETQLAEAEQKMAEYLDGWQRCQAAFANYRRRTEAEQIKLRKAANAALLTRILSIIDDFERAFGSVPKEWENHAWLEGVSLIQRKALSILESEDVKPIDLEPGDVFDPMYHQAIFHQEAEDFEEGQIIAEVERGYILGDKVLRPSMVVVAKGAAPLAVIKDSEQATAPEAETQEAATQDEATQDEAQDDAA